MVGAHDGVPAGTGGADAERLRWYDRYLRDVDNGVDREPAVQLWMADGDREDMINGRFVRASGDDWPLPGMEWTTLYLDAARSGTATSVNDGTLSAEPAGPATQRYLAIPSLPTATDPNTVATAGAYDAPLLTDMTLAEPLGLSYTSAPFTEDLDAVGPASVEVVLSSTAPETDILAVLSDVAPDGIAHPMATGRLRTSYPEIDRSRSLVDAHGTVVQPYAALRPEGPGCDRSGAPLPGGALADRQPLPGRPPPAAPPRRRVGLRHPEPPRDQHGPARRHGRLRAAPPRAPPHHCARHSHASSGRLLSAAGPLGPRDADARPSRHGHAGRLAGPRLQGGHGR